MKNLKSLLITFCLTLLYTSTIKAQDDPNAGWYVDGYKVTSISCYNFDKLQFVVPYNSEWESYDHISIRFWRGEKIVDYSGVKLYTLSAAQALKKGNYVVFSVITSEQSMPLQQNGHPDGTPNEIQSGLDFNINRWDCSYKVVDIGDRKKKDTPAEDVQLNATIYGLTQTEVIEKYDAGCQCIKKIPKYSSVKIEKSYAVIMTGRTWRKWNFPLNTTDACSYEGTKVDFNNLGVKKEAPKTEIKKEEPVKETKPAVKKKTGK